MNIFSFPTDMDVEVSLTIHQAIGDEPVGRYESAPMINVPEKAELDMMSNCK